MLLPTAAAAVTEQEEMFLSYCLSYQHQELWTQSEALKWVSEFNRLKRGWNSLALGLAWLSKPVGIHWLPLTWSTALSTELWQKAEWISTFYLSLSRLFLFFYFSVLFWHDFNLLWGSDSKMQRQVLSGTSHQVFGLSCRALLPKGWSTLLTCCTADPRLPAVLLPHGMGIAALPVLAAMVKGSGNLRLW